jgi:SAM-dependent methyltransferase
MENEFCTLFDVNYLPRGLVLYRSLQRHCDEFRLRVFCMDERTKDILDRLGLPRLTAIGLDELESHDADLLAVKPSRTPVEYCWTATPAVCAYALETEPELEAITYIDADLMFFRDPEPIWQEFSDDSILIVPHRYATRWQSMEDASGIYNVELVTFRRDERGLEALSWWRDRCLEWCYFRVEDGKMGDQKYLDDWPERFEGVHVLEHSGGGLAPWNVERYELASHNGSVLVDDRELIFYHYHALRLYRPVSVVRALGPLAADYRYTAGPSRFVWATHYPVGRTERELVWEPYIRELGKAMNEVCGGGGLTCVAGRRALVRDVVRPHLERVRWALRRVRSQFGPRDHSQSWKDEGVTRQMLALAREQLRQAETVPPYRAFLEAIEWALTELEPPEPARLLDFGCGVGHYSEMLARRYPERFEYVGCDYSPAMIDAARAEWPHREFIVNDLFANTLDLGKFDIVVASALVDITDDYERALDILLGSGARIILLHRQQVTEGRSRSEVAPGYAGQTTYRSYLNRRDLERIASRHGRQMVASFHVEGDIHSFLFGEAC